MYFTTAGAESNESAFKFARYYWKVKGKPEKTKFVSRIHGYHGVTMAAMSATGMAAYHKMFGPLEPTFLRVAPPYPYRWSGNEDPGIGAAEAVEQAILKEGADTVAAVIAEPVMGAGGVIVPPDTYWPALRRVCDKHDVLLIADEVITGFGRTGRMFALGRWNVEAAGLHHEYATAREEFRAALLDVVAFHHAGDPGAVEEECRKLLLLLE